MILIMSGFRDLKMLSAMRPLLVQETCSTFPCIGKNYFYEDYFFSSRCFIKCCKCIKKLPASVICLFWEDKFSATCRLLDGLSTIRIFTCLSSLRWHHIESLLNGGVTITVNFWYKVREVGHFIGVFVDSIPICDFLSPLFYVTRVHPPPRRLNIPWGPIRR